MELAIKGITAGIIYDLGSGSNVDLMIITRQGRTHLRNHIRVEQRKPEDGQPVQLIPNNFVVLKQAQIKSKTSGVNANSNGMEIEE